MAYYQLRLAEFEFPPTLPASKSNFRFLVYVRHIDETSQLWMTSEAVSPSLAGYWECDPSKKNKRTGIARYIRDGSNAKFAPIPKWDQVVLMFSSQQVVHVRVEVYDVDRTDWTDTFKSIGEGLIGALFSAAAQVPLPVPGLAAPAGTLLEQFRKSLLESFASENDLLFAADWLGPTGGTKWELRAASNDYTVVLSLDVLSPGVTAPFEEAAAISVPVEQASLFARKGN
jgi:hypothetical protein